MPLTTDRPSRPPALDSPALDSPALDSPGTPDQAEQRVAVDAVRALARVSRLLERCSDELTLAQYRVLSAVASGEERASHVARRLDLGKPTVSAAVEQLCQRGLVRRSGVVWDQRASALAVTDAGLAVLGVVEESMVDRLTGLCAMTEEPAETLAVIASLGDALDGESPQPAGSSAVGAHSADDSAMVVR